MYSYKTGIPLINDRGGGIEAGTNILLLTPSLSYTEQLARARYLSQMVTELKVPVVSAANKNDLPGCMREEEIRNGLGIAKDIPVFSISAQRRDERAPRP